MMQGHRGQGAEDDLRTVVQRIGQRQADQGEAHPQRHRAGAPQQAKRQRRGQACHARRGEHREEVFHQQRPQGARA